MEGVIKSFGGEDPERNRCRLWRCLGIQSRRRSGGLIGCARPEQMTAVVFPNCRLLVSTAMIRAKDSRSDVII